MAWRGLRKGYGERVYVGVDCVLRLTLSQRHIEDLGDPCESVAWLNVEARPRQDDSLEEVILRQLRLRHHLMSSIIEDDDNSELNDSDYSDSEEGSSRSLSIITCFFLP